MAKLILMLRAPRSKRHGDLPKHTDSDFEEWRDQEAWTAEKYAALIALVADRGWKRRFDDPIPLARGRKLVTLQDAV